MVVSQNIFSFFLPSRRRRPPVGGGRKAEDAATQRLLEGIDDAFSNVNVPAKVIDFIKEDIVDACKVETPTAAKYDPAAPSKFKVSLAELATDPIQTAWKTVKAPFKTEWADLISIGPYLTKTANDAAWNHLCDKVWVDDKGNPTIPDSLRGATDAWRGRVKIRGARLAAQKHVLESPGFTLMQSRRLAHHYSQLPGATYDAGVIDKATRFGSIETKAGEYDKKIADILKEQKDLKKLKGKDDDLKENWDKVDKLHKEWKEVSEGFREETSEEFKRLSGKGGPLYNSPEAQFTRYWKNRQLHHGVLNFLERYQKDGFWGVAKRYGWDWATKKIGYTKVLKGLKKGISKIPGLGRVAKLGFNLRHGFGTVTGKLTAKLVETVAERIGLKAAFTWIGGAIGSIVPGAGTAAGAVIGAVLQFFGAVVIEKMGGALKVVGYTIAGVVVFVGLFAVGIITLISIILSNDPNPGEGVGEVDCNQSATATAACVASKSAVKGIADNWGVGAGNQVEACYNDVIAKSKAKGVDPRISMATWLHESNASNYDVSVEDFGIPNRAGKGFTSQIEGFLNFYKQSKTTYSACYQGYSDAEGFFRTFCTAGRANLGVGACPNNLTGTGEGCVNDFMKVYNWINAC
ncbi:MAG: hypothetical protein BMS9Abin34_456 [Patescibacteria group bacterium]|nr:MAG: hypothetical protein BMS9Abin34_456 [Patescibacteria group bacterium]